MNKGYFKRTSSSLNITLNEYPIPLYLSSYKSPFIYIYTCTFKDLIALYHEQFFAENVCIQCTLKSDFTNYIYRLVGLICFCITLNTVYLSSRWETDQPRYLIHLYIVYRLLLNLIRCFFVGVIEKSIVFENIKLK